MPDALDGLLDDVGAADERARHSIAAAKIRSVAADQRTAEVEGVGLGWRLRARLWQPKLMLSEPHTHDIEGETTSQESNHDHSVPPAETSEDEGHTHTVVYAAGDIGILLRLGGGVPLFIGGLG